MKRNAFTLVEMIFVLLLIGFLGAVSTTLYRPSGVRNDAEFVRLKIERARYLGIGYDHRSFGGGVVAGGPGCVELTKEGLEGDPERAGAYRFRNETGLRLSGLAGNTLCFDAKGRPHDGDFALASLLEEPVDITVSGNRSEYLIRVFPYGGYATMKRK